MKVLVWHMAAVFAAGWGAVTDLKVHKIYNYLTMPSIAVGMLMHLSAEGPGGLMDSLLGLGAGIFCMLFWFLGMLKAGDVKLYMAVGALGGWKFCGYTIFYSILIGGIAALGIMLIRKSGRASLKRLWIYVLNLAYTKQFQPYRPEEKHAYFSFGSCIFAGTLAAVWHLY